jgi:hypothetical protein
VKLHGFTAVASSLASVKPAEAPKGRRRAKIPAGKTKMTHDNVRATCGEPVESMEGTDMKYSQVKLKIRQI